jgi:hypothetical protein
MAKARVRFGGKIKVKRRSSIIFFLLGVYIYNIIAS